MWIRILPGLVMAAALAVFFHFDAAEEPTHSSSSSPHALALIGRRDGRILFSPRKVSTATVTQPDVISMPELSAAPDHTIHDSMETAAMQQYVEPFDHSGSMAFCLPRPDRSLQDPLLAMMPAKSLSTPGYKTKAATPVHSTAVSGIATLVPAKDVSLSQKIASDKALALMDSLTGRPLPYASPSPMRPDFQDSPPKGVYAWGSVESFRENQRLRDEGRSAYRHDGTRYAFGAKYDWSLDTILGLSAELLDSDVKNKQFLDKRENTVTGYSLNAQYEALLYGRYLFSAQGTYGRYETKGSGQIGGMDDMGVITRHAWKEDRYTSHLLGFSGRFGLPLLWGDDIKILHEIGFDYRRLRSKSHTAAIDGVSSVIMPEVSSTSFRIPLQTTVKKEFLRSWGLFIPRLGAGLTVELDDSALGVRSYHASSASRFDYDPVSGFHSAGMRFDDSQKVRLEFGMGMDIKSIHGWELSADYQRHMSEKYANSIFTLELGRCF